MDFVSLTACPLPGTHEASSTRVGGGRMSGGSQVRVVCHLAAENLTGAHCFPTHASILNIVFPKAVFQNLFPHLDLESVQFDTVSLTCQGLTILLISMWDMSQFGFGELPALSSSHTGGSWGDSVIEEWRAGRTVSALSDTGREQRGSKQLGIGSLPFRC